MAAADRTGAVSAAVPLHAAMAALALAAGVALWPAPDPASAMTQTRALLVGIAGYGVTWALSRRRGLRHLVVAVALGLAAASAAYYLLQYRHLAPPEAKLPGLDAVGRTLSAPWPRLGAWTPFGNSLATLLEGMVAVAIGIAVARGARVTRVLAALAAAIVGAAVLLTASRGAWAAVVASIAALAYPQPLLRWPQAVAAAAVTALVAVVAGTVSAGGPWWIGWASIAGRPDRLDVFAQAAALLRDLPFTGVGAGDQFAAAAARHVLLIQVPFLTYAHQLWLQLWLELGLIGLAVWSALAGAMAVAVLAGERAGLGRRFRGVWAGLLAVQVHGLTDARQFVEPWTWIPFFVLAGVLAGYVSRGVRIRPRAAWLPAAVSAAVILAAVVGRGSPRAAWQVNLGAVAQSRAETAEAAGGDGAAARVRALQHLERARHIDGADGPALRRLGMLALDAGRYAEARALLSESWAVEPGRPATRKAYGLAAVCTGDTDLAASLLRDLPGAADELTTWSRWRRDRGERTLALHAARTALIIAPAQPELIAWLHDLESAAPPPP